MARYAEERSKMMEYTKIPNVFKREEGGGNKLIPGAWSTPELGYLAPLEWEWTEKVDGTNIRVIWDGYRVTFAGRTDKANIPGHLLARLEEIFGGPNKEEIFEQRFGVKHVILFGEGYGERIQKGGGLYGPADFILFDVYIADDEGTAGYWLVREAVDGIAGSFGIKTVPTVGSGTLYSAVEFVASHPKSQLRDAEMEGIVCRPQIQLFSRRGDRMIVKIKCRDF